MLALHVAHAGQVELFQDTQGLGHDYAARGRRRRGNDTRVPVAEDNRFAFHDPVCVEVLKTPDPPVFARFPHHPFRNRTPVKTIQAFLRDGFNGFRQRFLPDQVTDARRLAVLQEDPCCSRVLP